MQSASIDKYYTVNSGKWHLLKSYLDAIGAWGLCAKGISTTVPNAERRLCACSL